MQSPHPLLLKNRKLISAALLLLTLPFLSACSDDSNGSDPEIQPLPERSGTSYLEGRYLTRGQDNHLIEDTHTGLVWLRCALGQEWDNQSQHCIGRAATYTLQQAEEQASLHRHQPDDPNPSGFGLPSRDQLFSLIYCPDQPLTPDAIGQTQCSGTPTQATIVEDVFPDTERRTYWSNSRTETGSQTYDGIHFGLGTLSTDNSPNSRYPARLVRSLNH